MKNINLAYPNRIDESTLSAGSWLTTLPLNNLKDRRLSKLARSSDVTLASTKFRVALESARNIGVLALVVNNLSVVAQVKVTGYSDAGFSSVVYTSGWIAAWPSGVIPQNLLEWEDDNFWLGTLSQQALAGYRAPFVHYLTTSQVLQWWQVEIDDTTNGDSYVQIGRVFMGANWIPTYNASYGAALGFQDATTNESSLSGEEFFDARMRYRIYEFNLEWMTETEAYGNVMDMQQLLGISGEIFISGDPDDIINQPRRCFLARMDGLQPPAQSNYGRYSVKFRVKEIL